MRKIKLMSVLTGLALILSCCVGTAAAGAAVYEVDPAYSSILFKIRHLNGYNVGGFTRFGGIIETGENDRLKGVFAKIDAASIDTRHAERNEDLRSKDFLYTEKYPQASFVGKEIKEGRLIGDLTIRGKTREVAFDYRLGEAAEDQFGRTKIGLSAVGTFDRRDFGIKFNKLSSGNMLLGNDVQVLVELEGVLKEEK